MEQSIKGQSCLTARKFITERFGADGFNDLLSALDDGLSAFFSGKIMPSLWCPEKNFVAFLVAAEKKFDPSMQELLFEMGRYSATKSISTVYRIFLRLGDPAFIIARAGRVWSQLHNHARLEVLDAGDKRAKARLYGYTPAHKAFCRYLSGYFTGVLELSGARDISVTEAACVCDGAGYCEFQAVWA